MFCHHCGKEQSQSAQFCDHCGIRLADVPQQHPQPEALQQPVRIGYSSRIKDPSFAKYVSDSNLYAAIFSGVLAVAAVIGFYIYGERSKDMENPEALYIGLGIGSMFLIIAVTQIMNRNRSKTWDGVVVNKNIEHKQRKRNRRTEEYTVFTVSVQRDDNKKIYTQRNEDDDTVYQYFQIGDKVRHHGGVRTFEKYDKSRDTIIFCNACSSLNDINDEKCFRCNRPLLK